MMDLVVKGIVSLLILALTITVYFYYIRPKTQIKELKRLFEQKGYRVYEFPFKLFGFSQMNPIYAEVPNGSAMKAYKELFPKYDVTVGNYMGRLSVQLLNPTLLSEFAKGEAKFCYVKMKDFIKFLSKPQGIGLGLLEGDRWKQRRKLMSELFTY